MSLWNKFKNWLAQRKQVSQIKKTVKEPVVEKDPAGGYKIREVTKGRLITLHAFSLILKKMPEGFEKLPAREMFVKAMEAMIGVSEKGGNNSGADVESIQDTVGRAEKEAWCMGTVQTAVAFVEVVTGLGSRFPVTEHCMTALANSVVKYMNPKRGLVCIWQHGTSQAGHTGVVCDVTPPNDFMCIEGNTGPGGGVVREGDGVYKKARSIHKVGDMSVRGFLEPFA